MVPEFFTVCARFYYHLMRLLHFTDLYYDETLKRFENRPRNPRIRRYILWIYYLIPVFYTALITVTISFLIFTLWQAPGEYTTLQLISLTYVSLTLSVYISTFFLISIQVQRKRTSVFLKHFFNELFEIQQIISELTGRRAVLETNVKVLLLFKLTLIVTVFIVTLKIWRVINNFMAFPVFELAYIANYVVIIKLLKLQQDLKKWFKHQEEQYGPKSKCTAKCWTNNDPICTALSLWGQTGQMLANFRKYFGWFEKLVLLENIYCVYLSSQFIVCIFYKKYYKGAMLPDSLNHILNMLLIGMLNDAFMYEENSLNDIIVALASKLSRKTWLCGNCRELLKAFDIYFCCRNMRPNRVYILGSYWTREFAIDVIQNLILLGFSITQFGSDMTYFCNY